MPHWWLGINVADKAAVTVALVAGVQLLVTVIQVVGQWLRDRSAHREELRAVFAAAWCEYWKVQTTAGLWSTLDLDRAARHKLLRADDLLPFDPPKFQQLLGKLGMQPARFGGLALASAAAARDSIGILNALAEHYNTGIHLAEAQARKEEIVAEYKLKATPNVERIRKFASETESILEDALLSAPKWLHREELDLRGLSSPAAEKLRAHYGLERINRFTVARRDMKHWAKQRWAKIWNRTERTDVQEGT